MEIAVADDEKLIRDYICGLIKKQNPEYPLSVYAAGEELLASEKRFDIVFLDIQMEGINGIDTAKKLRERQGDAIIIFVTGLKEYVFDALDLYAFHYLLKPLDEKKFAEALEKAIAEVIKKNERKWLFIKTKNLTLDQSDILYIESKAKKVEIHTLGINKPIEIYASMDELEKQLSESFYRCHRSYIVNMSHISQYDNESITVLSGEKAYLTKKKYGEFVKAYMWFLQNEGVSGV